MDIALIRRRTRPTDGNYGTECCLIGVYAPGESTPILAITDHPGDVTYDGVTYTAYHCGAVPPDTDPQYALPQATIRISNVLRSLIASLHANDFYRDYTVQIIPYNDAEPAADYSTDAKELVWINHKLVVNGEGHGDDLLATLGVPAELTRAVPQDLCQANNCRHRFRLSAGVYGKRCGYTAGAISDVGLAPGDAITVRQTAHGFATGDLVELSDMSGVGITPSLDGYYMITVYPAEPANVFILNDTDGGDYSGSYNSGGKAGYYTCEQYRAACIARNRLASFGALSGQRSDALRVGV